MTIISFEAARKRKEDRAAPPVEFVVTAYRDGWFLEGMACSDDPGDRLNVADRLRELARLMNDKANELGGKEPDQILIDAQVYESGKIRTWASNRIETDEQAAWAVRQLGNADVKPVEADDGRGETPE